MKHAIIPIENEVCDHVRKNRTDPIFGYAHDVTYNIATPDGYGPCRSCLKKFRPGEARLLFLHNPFGNEYGDFAGPIFIHEKECEPFQPSHELTEELFDVPKFLRCYDSDGHFLLHKELKTGPVSSIVSEFFSDERCHTIHLRHIHARCYIAKAVRI